MALLQRRTAIAASLLMLLAASAWAEKPDPLTPASLTSAQVVERMQVRSRFQAEALRHFTAVRHYQIDYKGFGADVSAKMEVEVAFDAPAAKTFRVVSATGSKMLIDKVLKRLLDTEKEAANTQSATALSAANYHFEMAGNESVAGRPAFILRVEPLTDSKLLYRGKIWVDGEDFAVVKIEAEPAKNPSFWIAHTQISHSYAKTGGFWLPAQNRSESKVRIGGTAVLTIDYGTYQVEPATAKLVAAK